MTAKIIDGKELQQPIVARVGAAIRASGVTPELALLSVEHDLPQVRMQVEPTFALHVNFLTALGAKVRPHQLPNSTTHDELLALITDLNRDDSVDGIFLLVPPPAHIRMREVINAIDPAKELEGLHPEHAAKLLPVSLAEPDTPMIVLQTLKFVFDAVQLDFDGAHVAIVVEREALRGNIITQMVSKFGTGLAWPPDTTLTVLHSEHPRLAEYTRDADVVLLAIQTKPGLLTGDMVKPGASVFDFNAMVVGMSPHPTEPSRMVPELRGGADYESVSAVARVLCPAPRGFGPVMLAMLAENLIRAAVARRGGGR